LVPIQEGRLGPGSMKLLGDAELGDLLGSVPAAERVGVFLAGCAVEADRARLRDIGRGVWPAATVTVGSDRESGYAAAFGRGDGISVIAGTGSAVTGRHGGKEEQAGGWGHLLGDSGGGYDLAIRALRAVLFQYDTARTISDFARDILHALSLNTLRDLTSWVQAAQKSDLARLTPLLFNHEADPRIAAILREGAATLAALTASVARRLEFEHSPVRLTGGVFVHQPHYYRMFRAALGEAAPGAEVSVCETPASLGAAWLASRGEGAITRPAAAAVLPGADLETAHTEQTNPRSHGLDRLTTREMVALFIQEERWVEEALRHCEASLTEAVEIVSAALGEGGRLFYVGAGTSGRLGILDASEMPPTFGVAPTMVQGIIAGGAQAVFQSAEGAEDDAAAARRALDHRGVRAGDVVCGIAASGRTPFVRGALNAARRAGAKTILLTCNPEHLPLDPAPDIAIALPTGPEIIAGSTRLKAGTATKVALNIISSCAMVRLGRVEGNLMSHMQPTNEKLRARAIRLVATRLGVCEKSAKERLICSNWDIQKALLQSQARGQNETIS